MRFETFTFLPPLSPQQIEAQVLHSLQRKWVPNIEFAENPGTADFYWRQWPIPTVKVNSSTNRAETPTAGHIAAQLEACARRHPFAYVRFTAYNPATRQTEASFITRTPQEGN
jgi:ribulose-bisphosphate carboxylase small chain